MASINGSYYQPPSWKRSVLVWEMIILYYILSGKIKRGFVGYEFTSWELPYGFELQYVDYSNDWGIGRKDEINYPFRTEYVNSVYCKKGPLYVLFSICMRIKAAKIRDIKNWKKLDTERRILENNYLNQHNNFNTKTT